ncbi:DNA-binding protein [Polyplosphaeria fusca]|uniref:DNA-binding protein n=1 Tax=Polyplosphaeria fusca TaxID=682080 RepID=A0A9P4R2D9_9PLEO|nr:DNA-binding protein [Polyplosphaeria fusca]
MAPTYLDHLSHFASFLTAYVHTILYLRTLYPRTSFATSRFHNTPVHQSRHPLVCEWISDAVAAVRDELLKGTVARLAIVIFCYGGVEKESSGCVRILERFMLDVGAFPVVDKGERNMEIEWEGSERDEGEAEVVVDAEEDSEEDAGADTKHKGKERAPDEHVDVDMSEQFRAAFVMLTTRCSQLKPLPKNCSFNISIELKDEADVDPPVGHPQPWVPVQPSLQKTKRNGAEPEDKGVKEGKSKEGQDLGGVKVTPIRSVEAGVFRFETWVEEGKAKFELDHAPKNSVASSGG